MTILPGSFSDDIVISIIHAPLAASSPDQTQQPSRPTLVALRKSLPPNWQAYENLEGRYIFEHEEEPQYTTWIHPDTGFEGNADNLDPIPEAVGSVKFEALSYTWGASDELKTIHVCNPSGNDASPSSPSSYLFPVRENLLAALRFLRYEDRSRTMWIDAICINQQDISERDSQVARIASNYSLASRVVI